MKNMQPDRGGKSRDLRFRGTALFLKHNQRRYLLTARHVVWDEIEAKRDFNEEAERAQNWPENQRQYMLQRADKNAKNNIFSIIFRVLSLGEAMREQNNNQYSFLMNLGAGASFTVPYTFSEPSRDLSIISLDQRDGRFADELESRGYVAISSDEIGDEPDAEGQDVFTVGFPDSTSVIGEITQHPASANWSSKYFSLPISTFGKVAMLHDALEFFWVDMSVLPGNSGGPVVANDKLVGIVSRQATCGIDQSPDVRVRYPFAQIIKSKFVHDLLAQQEQKDQR